MILAYSTYLGGIGTDVGEGIAVDSSGRADVTGYTLSANFPPVLAFQGQLAGGPVDGSDAFVARVSASGSALVFSTYLGGTGDDYGRGIAVDARGDAYIIGQTDSKDFLFVNPIQAANGGSSDVFMAEVDPSSSALVFSTYLGGSQDDIGTAIAVDDAGAIYGTGYTYSTDFPTTVGAFRRTLSGATDAIVFKVSA